MSKQKSSVAPFREQPINVVEQWQSKLVRELKYCATIKEEVTTPDGLTKTITHMVPYHPNGKPIHGKTGDKQFRFKGVRASIVFGLYEQERRSSEETLTASHLCHRGFDNPIVTTLNGKKVSSMCVNPAHICAETLAANKARNGCPSGAACKHSPKCLVPGHFHATTGHYSKRGFPE